MSSVDTDYLLDSTQRVINIARDNIMATACILSYHNDYNALKKIAQQYIDSFESIINELEKNGLKKGANVLKELKNGKVNNEK